MEAQIENPLMRPSAHHLVTLLKEIQRGRKAEQQLLIQEWIDSFNYNYLETTVEGIEEGDYCPLPLSVIPEGMGIQLSNVKNINWLQDDNQKLVSLTINFK